MISIYLISIVIAKGENKFNTIGAAAFIILIWHPWALFELSFQLSFAAVLGILLANKLYPFKFSTFFDKLWSFTKVTVSASLATFPLIINYFGTTPLISIPANLIFVPFIELIIVPLSLISIVAYTILPVLAIPLVKLNGIFVEILVFGTRMFLKIPYSSITLPKLSSVSIAIFFISLIVIILIRYYPRLKYMIPALVLAFALSASQILMSTPGDSGLEISFLDAGKTKSPVLITLVGGENCLILSGYSKFDRKGFIEEAVVGKYLSYNGIENIDYLIATTTDKDTLEGIVILADKFNVGRLFTNGDKLSSKVWELIENTDVVWNDLSDIDGSIKLGNAEIRIFKTGNETDIRDSSLPKPIVLKISAADFSMILSESINRSSIQESLINSYGLELKSGIIYIQNSNDEGMSEHFINTVSPKLIISNNLSPEQKKVLAASNSTSGLVDIIETATQGTVTINIKDGQLSRRAYIDSK